MKTLHVLLFILSFAFAASGQNSVPVAADNNASMIELITIHPLFAASYMCSEHWEGQLAYPGDNLGSDCVIFGGEVTDKGGFMKPYRTNGSTNEDWYGWMVPVLAPFDSEVERINTNPVVNKPGELGKPPASFVLFKRTDGTRVLLAHVTEINVKVGDKVRAGQAVAKVGNNGFGRMPHIHVGAWRDKTPLQIRFDLAAMGRLYKQK